MVLESMRNRNVLPFRTSVPRTCVLGALVAPVAVHGLLVICSVACSELDAVPGERQLSQCRAGWKDDFTGLTRFSPACGAFSTRA